MNARHNNLTATITLINSLPLDEKARKRANLIIGAAKNAKENNHTTAFSGAMVALNNLVLDHTPQVPQPQRISALEALLSQAQEMNRDLPGLDEYCAACDEGCAAPCTSPPW